MRQWREMCNEKFHQAYNVPYSIECIWPLYLWWSPFTLATGVGGKTHRSVKNMNFYRCMTVVISLITSLKSDLCTALTMHNTNDNNCVLSHAQNTTAVQPNIYFTDDTSFALQKQGTVAFPQSKKISRSTANSAVSICTALHKNITVITWMRIRWEREHLEVPNNTSDGCQLCFGQVWLWDVTSPLC